jgi:hypothetical protein
MVAARIIATLQFGAAFAAAPIHDAELQPVLGIRYEVRGAALQSAP